MIKVTIKIDEPQNPSKNLEYKGYKFEETIFDRRNKKHTIFSKDGVFFEFKGCDLQGERPVIKLADYQY